MASPPSTNLSLIDRIKNNSELAWEDFCEIYGPVVYSWARKRGLQTNDATDVTQETFNSVLRKIGSWEPGGFRKWLWTVFRSRLMDFYRLKKKNPTAVGGSAANHQFQDIPENPVDVDNEEGQNEVLQIYHRVLDIAKKTIDEKHWEAFVRVAVNGDSPENVAQDLGISVWTVYKCRSRVLQRLNREMDGLDFDIRF